MKFDGIPFCLFFLRIQSHPYIMLKDSPVRLEGNDRFEGFGIDIIDELSKLYGFKYNFIIYGTDYGKYDPKNGNWT